MDTNVSVKCYGKNAQKAIDEVEQMLVQTENNISAFIDGTDIQRINANSGKAPVLVCDQTLNLLMRSIELCKISENTFDITVGPLSFKWKDFFKTNVLPQAQAIDDAVKLIDYKKIVIDEQNKTVLLPVEGMAIDLGGIAKGYVCNYFSDIMAKHKISSAIISIGGNIYTYKPKPDGKKYVLGIRDPLKTPNDFMGKLTTVDTVVATSGAYERSVVKDDVTYHHIIDISTGYPSDSDLLSVTVVSSDGALADFLSTSIYLQGSKNIERHLNQQDYSVIIIDKNNNVFISEKIKGDFVLSNSSFTLR